MKVKARKTSRSFGAIQKVTDLTQKKRKNEHKSLSRTKDAATALITSSGRKYRPGSNAARSDEGSRKTRSKTDSQGTVTTDVRDECRDLRLAFSSIDGASTDCKGVSAALDSIFSPVFHLFKGLNGEPSNSCTSSIEQAESSDEKVEEDDTRVKHHHATSSHAVGVINVSTSSCTVAVEQVPEKVVTSLSTTKASPNCSFENGSDFTDDPRVFGPQSAHGVDEGCLDGDENRDPVQINKHMEEDGPEEASLYLAVQQTKTLDCSQESKKPDTAADEDDLDDFDPYLFIKYLPDLSEVVSPLRSTILLPKQTRRCPPITLVLDLDETLVHSTLELCEDADFTFPVMFNSQEYTVYVKRRPHLQMFMERVAQMFEIIVFTASQSIYAEQLLNVLDPKRKLIRHRVFRDSCIFVEGNYLKDLTVLGRDLAKVAIIDNSPQAFGFQVDNGIPIESWFDDKSDSALAVLLPFLETLVGVDDVRPIIASKFKLRQKVAAAVDPW